MKVVTITKVIAVAEDGKEFDSETECIAYEARQKEILKNTTYWRVITSPDLTEGRGWYETRYISIYHELLVHHEMLLQDWLYRNEGRPIAFVQGVELIANYIYRKIDMDEYFNNRKANNVGDTKGSIEVIALKQGPGEKGLIEV